MRFYASSDSIYPDKKIIHIKDRDEIHHIRDVMRLKRGDEVNIFDGTGREFLGYIKEIKREFILICIQEILPSRDKGSIHITLYQAILKRDKMDFIIEKAAELGVDRIVPVITERTIPHIKVDSKSRLKRWSKIAISASKQSGRIVLPCIDDIKSFDTALMEARKNDLLILAALDIDSVPLKKVLEAANPKEICIFIGPEGDFTKDEVSLAREAGYKIVSLGKQVLKSETAAIYVMSCILYEYNSI